LMFENYDQRGKWLYDKERVGSMPKRVIQRSHR